MTRFFATQCAAAFRHRHVCPRHLSARFFGFCPGRQGSPRRLGDLQSRLDAAQGQGIPREGIRQGRRDRTLGPDRVVQQCAAIPQRRFDRPRIDRRLAALVAKINGNPIKSVYTYSRPEWTALVVAKDSKISKLEDLRGKKIAMVRGTDPHIFTVRALLSVGTSPTRTTRRFWCSSMSTAAPRSFAATSMPGPVSIRRCAVRGEGRRQAVLPQARSQYLGHPQRA